MIEVDLHSIYNPLWQRDATRKPRVELRLKRRKRQRQQRLHNVNRNGHNNRWLQHQQDQDHKVPTVSLKSRSPLMTVLLILLQLAILDDWNLLPTGILLYVVGIPMCFEEFSRTDRGGYINNFVDRLLLSREDDEDLLLRMEQNNEILQSRIHAAMFEYHVLRNRPHVQIVPMEIEDRIALYAIS